jgi:N-acetylneuraminic acid mutarotase
MPPRLLKTAALAAFTLTALACNGDDGPTPSATPDDGTATGAPDATVTGDSATGATWRTLAPMPTPRSEVAAAAVGGKIYVAGGFLADGSATTVVEVYDPATDKWDSIEPLPETRHHTAAVGLDGRLYVIGGFQTSFRDAVNTTFIYDPVSASWSEGAPMSEPRGAHGVTSFDGRIYAVGGARPGPADAPQNIATVEAYDPSTDSWETTADLLSPRDHLAVVAGDDGIYAIGGRSNIDFGRNLSANEGYAPHRQDADEWQSRALLPTARSGIAAALHKGRIYVFGGEESAGTFDENEVYNPATDTWETLEPMPTARHGLGAAVVGDTIYVIGGGETPGLSVSGANEAFTP